METKQVEIKYVSYLDVYRIYDANKPENTFAYADTLDEAVALAEENEDVSISILCDSI